MWTGIGMFLHFVVLDLKVTVSARTGNFSEETNQLMFLQLRKGNHLLTTVLLALVLQLLDQPGSEQGGGVAKVDHAGGALGLLLSSLILSLQVLHTK